MIREGIDGSLCVYWKGCLICSYPLDYSKISGKDGRPDEYFTKEGNEIIVLMMREAKFNIKQQINHYKMICNDVHKRKVEEGKAIWASDYEMFTTSIYALRKLKFIDDDLHIRDGIAFFPRYKKKSLKSKS
jgi:hypothetical protein